MINKYSVPQNLSIFLIMFFGMILFTFKVLFEVFKDFRTDNTLLIIYSILLAICSVVMIISYTNLFNIIKQRFLLS